MGEIMSDDAQPSIAELKRLQEGLSNKIIADRLNISICTAKFHVLNLAKKLGARSRAHIVTLATRQRLDSLRPMSEAPTTGPIVEILAATSDRAGCKGWLIVHYADGGGEEQPRFRGWFFWTGYSFDQIDETKLLGWLPLPSADGYRARPA